MEILGIDRKTALIAGAILLFIIFLMIKKEVAKQKERKAATDTRVQIDNTEVRSTFDKTGLARTVIAKFATFGATTTDERIEILIEIYYLSDSEILLLNKEIYKQTSGTLRETLNNAWIFVDLSGYKNKTFARLDKLKI